MITLKIDVMKLDKSRFFEGKKGAKYADLVLIETPNSEFGDYMVTQSVSREEREKGVKLPILGNAKIFRSRKEPAQKKPASKPVEGDGPPESDDDKLPF